MDGPINSGFVDPWEAWDALDHSEAKVCDAGHKYSPHKPCPICGATGDQECNGGQYVLPQLRAKPRTLSRAWAERDTPLQASRRHHIDRLRAMATEACNKAAEAARNGDTKSAHYHQDDADALALAAAALEAK